MRRIIGGTVSTCIASVVLSLTIVSLSHAKIDPKNIAGLWLFDEGKGATAADLSGRGNNGELMGSVKWGKGKFGSAVVLDGVASNYVSVPSSDSLGMKDEVTVMFWVNTTKKMVDMWNDRQVVVGKHYLEYEVGIYTGGQLHTYSSDLAGNYDEGIMTTLNGKLPTGEADWEQNKWFHVAWTLKGQHEIAYVNGVKLDEYDKAHKGTKPDAHPLEIGRRVGGGLPLTGSIDEVAVFNIALDAKDIQTAADRGLAVAIGIAPVEPAGKLATTWSDIKKH